MILKIFTIIILFCFLYFILEILKRKLIINKIITRKIAHSSSVLLALALSFIVEKNIFMLITFFFLLFFIFSKYKNILTSIHIKTPKTYGEIFLPIALILLATFFYDNNFIFFSSLLVLGISDTITGLYNFKISKFISTLGSFLFFISSLFIIASTYLLTIEPLTTLLSLKLLMISMIITFIERRSTLGLDNLTVPLSLAILLLLI